MDVPDWQKSSFQNLIQGPDPFHLGVWPSSTNGLQYVCIMSKEEGIYMPGMKMVHILHSIA